MATEYRVLGPLEALADGVPTKLGGARPRAGVGTAVRRRGYIGLEEDVVVSAEGVEWLSTAQRELWLVP